MSLVQKIISTVLHAGHSGKQVNHDDLDMTYI